MLPDTRGSVWRDVLSSDQSAYVSTQVYSNIECTIVPLSEFDQVIAYARETTHVLFVPSWLVLRKEDIIKTGRAQPNARGDIQPFAFTIVGKQRLHLGMHRSTYFVRQLD